LRALRKEKVVTVHRIETEFAGRTLVIESGKMAKQAAGSCLVRFGDTMVLAAVTVSKTVSTLPFFPLTVEYREKTYAAGKIRAGSSSAKAGRRTRKSLPPAASTGPSGRSSPRASRTRSRSS
jgi:polyribonucleotide nucleotidyltransferase